MSQGDSNPAAVPHAAEDIQGDDRWMSQVRLRRGGGQRTLNPLCWEGCWASAARAPSGRSSRSEAVTALLPQSWQAVGTRLSRNDEVGQKAALLRDPKAALWHRVGKQLRQLGEVANPFCQTKCRAALSGAPLCEGVTTLQAAAVKRLDCPSLAAALPPRRGETARGSSLQ